MKLIRIFAPTRAKLQLLFLLVLYVVVASLALGSFNTARNVEPNSVPPAAYVLLGLATPAIVLDIPFIYISSNMFTTETSLRDVYTASGAVLSSNDHNPMLDKPIKKMTGAGIVTGIFAELGELYVLACLLSFIKRKLKKKS